MLLYFRSKADSCSWGSPDIHHARTAVHGSTHIREMRATTPPYTNKIQLLKVKNAIIQNEYKFGFLPTLQQIYQKNSRVCLLVIPTSYIRVGSLSMFKVSKMWVSLYHKSGATPVKSLTNRTKSGVGKKTIKFTDSRLLTKIIFFM